MLEIFNHLKPFFNDCYRKISVREYAKILDISPPTASILLNLYFKEGLLKREEDRIYLFFSADRDSWMFVDLCKTYWKNLLEKIGFIEYLSNEYKIANIILFGSLSKAEVTENSDIDMAIISVSDKKINFQKFEKKLGRKIQIFRFDSIKDIKNKELLNNILKGYNLSGAEYGLEKCNKQKLVKEIKTDPELVKSLIMQSNNKLYSSNLLELDIRTAASKFILVYDSLRELLEALAINKGYKIYNHDCYASFLNEIVKDENSAKIFDELRKIRNGINYYGNTISLKEGEALIKQTKILINIVMKYLEK